MPSLPPLGRPTSAVVCRGLLARRADCRPAAGQRDADPRLMRRQTPVLEGAEFEACVNPYDCRCVALFTGLEVETALPALNVVEGEREPIRGRHDLSCPELRDLVRTPAER